MTPLLSIDPKKEKQKIVSFIRDTLQKTGFKNVILAVSGGIDSATSLNVLKESLPLEHIFVVHLPYFQHTKEFFYEAIKPLSLPEKNIHLSPINKMVDPVLKQLGLENPTSEKEKVRRGNVMARIRMITLYDLARQHDALVCGTENKSEYYLGYFTRFGDAASDFEPISHLYKTQIYQLAEYLGVPSKIREVPPSAGLWQSQTDEEELGFTYKEADEVLYQYFDKKVPVEQIDSHIYPHARDILEHVNKMQFKHEVPYSLFNL